MKGIKITFFVIVLMVSLVGLEKNAEARSGFSVGFSYHRPAYFYPYHSYYWGPYWWYGYNYYYRPYYYRPYYYGSFHGAPYYYYGYGEIRLEVKPKTAKVYLNGDYVGVVDDFDSWWQRLQLEPGKHRIVIRERGFSPIVETIRVLPGRNYHIEQNMHPGQDVIAEQDMRPPRDERDYPPRYRERRDYDRDKEYERDRDYERDDDDNGAQSNLGPEGYEGEQEEQQAQESFAEGADTRKLIVQVRPMDATIYVDGNYYGTADIQGTGEVQILLRNGMHRIEIVRPGYESFTREINMADMANEKLIINLEKK